MCAVCGSKIGYLDGYEYNISPHGTMYKYGDEDLLLSAKDFPLLCDPNLLNLCERCADIVFSRNDMRSFVFELKYAAANKDTFKNIDWFEIFYSIQEVDDKYFYIYLYGGERIKITSKNYMRAPSAIIKLINRILDVAQKRFIEKFNDILVDVMIDVLDFHIYAKKAKERGRFTYGELSKMSLVNPNKISKMHKLGIIDIAYIDNYVYIVKKIKSNAHLK